MRQAAIMVFNAAVTPDANQRVPAGLFASDPQKFSQLELVVNGDFEM
jgi:hypothetical protein